ncbi:MAG: GDP-mannose 4,6-dehydratase [Nitrososphaerales archaeon]
MKALVTGGAGFIASHLIDLLLERGYSVTAFDNLSQGKRKNLKHLANNPKVEIKIGDLKNPRSVANAVRGTDVVFHLAAHANIRASAKDHMIDLNNNLVGTINILEAMTKYKVDDLVFASTSALYGEAKVRPTPETYHSIQTSLYGASKLACEAYAESYTEISPIKFWAFRFSNIIGERCRRGVIWDFVNKLRSNSRGLEILGDGKQSKEYLYVRDTVEGIWTGYQKSHEKVNIFNLAIEENTIVDKIADFVIEEMKLSNVKRTYTGERRGWIGDNPIVHLDISKIKALGWNPKITSEEAIRRTTKWTIQETAR